MKKIKYFLLGLFFLCSMGGTVDMNAQCPMCRMSAESNLQNGGSEGKGLNKGIFLLLAMPYVLIGTIGIVWYRSKQNQDEAKAE